MSTIDPTKGTPIARPTADRPKAASPTEKFTLPTDTVSTRPPLSFGSLGPLVNSNLSTEAALDTAKRLEALLVTQDLPVVNNRPQVLAGLFEEGKGKG
jgi:hypothetical protein